MLRYLGHGIRRFGVKPMYTHRRANWEFFAVLKGRCGVQWSGRDVTPLRAHRMWVLPPDCSHGWYGDAADCLVAIFHFGSVPRPLERAVRTHGHLEVPLDAGQRRMIGKLVKELTPHYTRMTERSTMVFDRALLDLSLAAMSTIPAAPGETGNDFARRKVDACLLWYCEHMNQRPKLEEAARAVNLSVRHLRRLFHQIREESPQAAFTALRIHRAMEMLSQTDRKLDIIAQECGFAGSSDFIRVFKARQKTSPDAWRRNLLQNCG